MKEERTYGCRCVCTVNGLVDGIPEPTSRTGILVNISPELLNGHR